MEGLQPHMKIRESRKQKRCVDITILSFGQLKSLSGSRMGGAQRASTGLAGMAPL